MDIEEKTQHAHTEVASEHLILNAHDHSHNGEKLIGH